MKLFMPRFFQTSQQGHRPPHRSGGLGILCMGFALFHAFSTTAWAAGCACEEGYDIYLSGSIPDFKAFGGGAPVPAISLPDLKLEPEITYSFSLSKGGEEVGCEDGWVHLQCGLQYKNSNTGGAWVSGTKFRVAVQNKQLVPSNFQVRVSGGDTGNPGEDDDGESGGGGGGNPEIPATENPATASSSGIEAPGLRFSLPLGQIGMGSNGGSPYRSVGVLSWAGPVDEPFAKAINVAYKGPEELTSLIQLVAPGSYPEERHLETPTRFFRVTGYNTDPGATATFSTALNTYIREYEKLSASEDEAVSFGRGPISWWKISQITDGVKIEQSVRGAYRQKTYVASATGQLTVGDGTRETATTATPPSGGSYSTMENITEGSTFISAKFTEYETVNGQYRISYEEVFPESANGPSLETSYGYYPAGPAAGKLWWISNPDGSWVVYEYPATGDERGETVTYTPSDSDATLNVEHSDINTLPLIPATGLTDSTAFIRRTWTKGSFEYLVSLDKTKKTAIREIESSLEAPVDNVTDDAITDNTIPLVERAGNFYYSQAIESISSNRWLAGRPILVTEKSGRAEYYTYSRTDASVNGLDIQPIVTETRTTGFVQPKGSSSPTVGDVMFTVVPGLSEQTISKYGADGLLRVETKYHTGSDFSPAKAEVFDYEDRRYLSTKIDDIEVHRVEWLPDSVTKVEKNRQGQVTKTKFDAQGEIEWIEKAAGGEVAALRTSYIRNGSTTIKKLNGTTIGVTTVDGMGRAVSSTDSTGATTLYEYPNGGRDRKVILPGQIEQTTEYHLDGSLKAKSGDGWIKEYHDSGLDDFWAYFEKSSFGSATGHTERFTTTYYNGNGTVDRVVKPSPALGGKFIEETYGYSTNEVLLKIVPREIDADGATVTTLPIRRFSQTDALVETDVVALRGVQISGLDGLSGNPAVSDGQLAFGSADRFTRREVSFVLVNGVVYRKTLDYRYPDPSGANPLITETLESLSFVKVGSSSYTSTAKVTAPSGRSVTTTTLVTPSTATVITTEEDSATSATTDKLTKNVNGYLQSVAKAGNSVNETYAYDSFGRVKHYTDARTAATFSYYENFQLSEVADQLRGTQSYTYYLPGEKHAGKVKSVTKPGGAIEETSYNERGQVKRISGSGVYIQEYAYDPQYGDRTTLTTFGTATAVTRWNYQSGTGILASKRYDDANLTGKGFDYQYGPDGKLKKRTSARGVVTTYTYDSPVRDLTGIAYTSDSDLTPDISIPSYDGLGRPKQVTESKSGTDLHVNSQMLSYQPYSGAVTTTYTSGHRWLNGVVVEQSSDDSMGRPGGHAVKVGGSPVSSQTYHYDPVLGRLVQVNSGDLGSAIAYLPGTDLLQQVDVTNGGNVIHRRTLAIDMLGRTVGVVNRAGLNASSLGTIASVGHQLDAAGRRDTARREDGTWWDYEYNDRSEVIGAVKKIAGSGGEKVVPGMGFGYRYDGIGNREKSWSGSDSESAPTRTYPRNALNQYTGIAHSGRFDILTRSDASVSATASGAMINGVEQEGNLYGVRLSRAMADNTAGKLATATIARSGVTAGTVKTWVPPATVSPSYDLDGNLISDGRWTYVWDGEDRLVSMTPVTTALTAGVPSVQLKFAYDWQGRRIGKTIVDSTPGSASTVHLSYAYDQWNPVAEWKRTSLAGSLSGTALLRTHLWGLDIGSSGKVGPREASFQAAGGIASLLVSTWHSTSTSKEQFIPSYDANGNIIAWSGINGALLQRKDYDPFGNTVLSESFAASSVIENLPAFGFATKMIDAESGLYYYGHRYYDPVIGRWISRDPIGERGGIGLYAMVGNQPISKADVRGLFPTPGYWYDPQTGKAHGAKCMISIFVGHNHEVPQGEVLVARCSAEDDPEDNSVQNETKCSASVTIACGNLGVDEENGETKPAPPTVPGVAAPTEGVKLDGNDVGSQLKKAIKASKYHASKICNNSCCNCDWVTIVVVYNSNLDWTAYDDRERSGNEDNTYPVPCKKK